MVNISNKNKACCDLEDKIDLNTAPPRLVTGSNGNKAHENHQHDQHNHAHTSPDGQNLIDHGDHTHVAPEGFRTYLPAVVSLILLVLGLLLEHVWEVSFFKDPIKFGYYLIAYIPVGLPVMREGWYALRNGQLFTEFFLMSIATIGAFAIGEYPEGVAVMLFYSVGELFQSSAVRRAKGNIKALLDVRPNVATVYRNGNYLEIEPSRVEIGEKIQVKVGEKIPLDGVLISDKASLNTAALTGESKPDTKLANEEVLAGSINLQGLIEVKVSKLFHESSIARILDLVQNATAKKAKTELLIRRLAKIYTPIVVYLAIAICFVPFFFVDHYIFQDWLYRALIFLVISCPCALVISIPLGYFGGLGAASKNGILFKGATYLEQLTDVNYLVFDKTGTVTKGVFNIADIKAYGGLKEEDMMKLLLAMESKSTHPIAKAIMAYPHEFNLPEVTDFEEIAGKGLVGNIEDKKVLVGNSKLLQDHGINLPSEIREIIETVVLLAVNQNFTGYVILADELKADAKSSIAQLKNSGIKHFMMLSGDKDSITQKIAAELGIESAKGGLLPEDKLLEVEKIKENPKNVVAFIGDGINDAPVLAISDVGIAMGGLGSDVAIETADVIIQTDQPSKVATGIAIGKSTKQVIWQNIALAFGVKALVLILGTMGLATLWQAVFADVGVALLAILNAIRLQRKIW